jgi:hypothetical protein
MFESFPYADSSSVIIKFQPYLKIVNRHKLECHFCDNEHPNLKPVAKKGPADICAEGFHALF